MTMRHVAPTTAPSQISQSDEIHLDADIYSFANQGIAIAGFAIKQHSNPALAAEGERWRQILTGYKSESAAWLKKRGIPVTKIMTGLPSEVTLPASTLVSMNSMPSRDLAVSMLRYIAGFQKSDHLAIGDTDLKALRAKVTQFAVTAKATLLPIAQVQ